jgi:hypothetical protein
MMMMGLQRGNCDQSRSVVIFDRGFLRMRRYWFYVCVCVEGAVEFLTTLLAVSNALVAIELSSRCYCVSSCWIEGGVYFCG